MIRLPGLAGMDRRSGQAEAGLRVPRRREALRRFLGDDSGASAIEFAFFGTLMLILMMVLFQYAIVYMARQNLDNALQVGARALMTGSFQRGTSSTANAATITSNLRAVMCGNSDAPALFYTCNDMKVDVRISGSGGSGPAVDAKTGTWSDTFGTSYSCPGPTSIAVIRAAVRLPLLVPMFKLGLSGFAGNAALVQAATVIRVEPYPVTGAGKC